jgi:structural maintenance of chromosome 4
MGKYEQLTADFQGKKAEEEAQLEKIMEGLQEATKELRARLEAVQTDLVVQEKAVSTIQTEKESVETSVKLLQARANAATKSMSATEDKLAKLRADMESTDAKIVALDGEERIALESNIASTEAATVALANEEASLQAALREAVTTAELGKATLAAQQTRPGCNAVVQKVLHASKRGGILGAAGVRGRLGDLATIAPQYDVAISTACGLLDHIVVDNATGAQACINYLREANLGRASFIALDQMQEWTAKMSAAVNPPAGAPRLFDLINIADEALRPAFYMALRDTLVADTLDQAVKIAYQGDRAVWRVVTQDGKLVDTSGAMSGGGKDMKSGAMKLSTGASASSKASKGAAAVVDAGSEAAVTPELIQQYEQAVVQLQQQLSGCRAKKAHAESTLKELKKLLKDMHTEVEKSKMAAARFKEQEVELKARLKEIARECQLSPEEARSVEENQQKLERLEAEMSIKSPNLRTLQTEVASLQRQILSVGGPKLTKIQAKIDSLTAQLDTFSCSLSTKSVEEANCRKQAEKAAAIRTKAEQECEKAEAKLVQLVAQQKEMEADALEVVTAVEAARELMVGLEQQLQTISTEYHDLKSQVGKLKNVEVDLNVELERIAQALKEHKLSAKKWRIEADAVRKQHEEDQREFLAVIRSAIPAAAAAPAVVAATVESDSAMAVVDEQAESTTDTDAEIECLPILAAEDLLDMDAEELKREINALEAQKNK